MNPLTLTAALGYAFIGGIIGGVFGIGIGVIATMESTEYRLQCEKLLAAKEARAKAAGLLDRINMTIMKAAEEKYKAGK